MANLSSGVDIVHATRQVCCPAEKTAGKKLHDWKKCWLHLCKLETCTYISLAAMYGLTAIDKILVAGWKHASFLCYSMGARWFLRFLGPKLELPRSSAYSPYLRRLWSCVSDGLWVRVDCVRPVPVMACERVLMCVSCVSDGLWVRVDVCVLCPWRPVRMCWCVRPVSVTACERVLMCASWVSDGLCACVDVCVLRQWRPVRVCWCVCPASVTACERVLMCVSCISYGLWARVDVWRPVRVCWCVRPASVTACECMLMCVSCVRDGLCACVDVWVLCQWRPVSACWCMTACRHVLLCELGWAVCAGCSAGVWSQHDLQALGRGLPRHLCLPGRSGAV